MDLLNICWQAIVIMLAIAALVAFLMLMVNWAVEWRWSWRKITGTIVLSLFILTVIGAMYWSLSNEICG